MFNFNTQKHLNRRTVLKSSGAAIALPFLSAMLPAHAKDKKRDTSPKRFMAVCSGLGYHGPNFSPETSGLNYKPSPYLNILKSHLVA